MFSSCSGNRSEVVKQADCLKINSILDKIDPDLIDSNSQVQVEFKRLWINLNDEKLILTVKNIAEIDSNQSYQESERIFSDNMIAIFSYCKEVFANKP